MINKTDEEIIDEISRRITKPHADRFNRCFELEWEAKVEEMRQYVENLKNKRAESL